MSWETVTMLWMLIMVIGTEQRKNIWFCYTLTLDPQVKIVFIVSSQTLRSQILQGLPVYITCAMLSKSISVLLMFFFLPLQYFCFLLTCSIHLFSCHPPYVAVTSCPALSVFVNVVRQSQFKIRFKLQDWLWLSVVPSEFLPTRNLAFNGALPCCLT